MTADFLQEVVNHKSVIRDEGSLIVEFHGISQEPATGNYVMVMSYMVGGNLHEFLQLNYKNLDFQYRLNQLLQISQGLYSIHETGLVHQDLHVGNVLNFVLDNRVHSYISDLGLSRPVSETNKDKIYGILPYVAP